MSRYCDSFKNSVLKILNNRVRRNSLITKLIFGVETKGNQRIHWDFTTLVLGDFLVQRVRTGYRVLEIGTGPYAILSILLLKHVACKVVACDISEVYVKEAIRTARINSVLLNVVCSDLFSNIDGEFNVIFFNSVYIPRQVGERLGIDKLHNRETDWCGGENGVEIIDRFLREASTHLMESGEILLGFNAKYLNQDLVVKLCEDHGYSLKTVFSKSFNPSQVLVISQEAQR